MRGAPKSWTNKRIRWCISRIRAMSFSELTWRIGRKIGANLQKIRLYLLTSVSDKQGYLTKMEDLTTSGQGCSEFLKNFILQDEKNDIRKLYHELFSECQINTIQKANAILHHRFDFFDCKNVSLGKKINWHLDYKTGKGWPKKFWDDINPRSSEIGDIKYVWELNRHQHFFLLGKAYFITGEEKYAEEICSQLESWMDQNPPYYGVNWISPLELSLRIISWLVSLDFIKDSTSLTRYLFSKIIKYIYLQAEFIKKNLSKYSSANNHLIGEGAGLFIAGIFFPHLKKASKWKKRGYDILVEEMKKQSYTDGVNKEQAISYQCFVLDFFLLAGLLGKKAGINFPDSYWQGLEKMMEFIFSIMDCKGNVPNIGDSDDGQVIVFDSATNFNPYCSLLATGAVLFERADFKYKATEFDEKSFWLLGQEGKKKFEEIVIQGERITSFLQSRAFPEGGYYILRSGRGGDEIVMVFDCGTLGYLSLAAHGHSDALSFTLNVGGNPVFIDTGTYTYHVDEEWRNYFRGTAAHNTIRIDKENQSVMEGPFLWGKKAKACIENWKFTEKYDIVRGYHDGYTRLKDPVIHKREIFFDKAKGVFVIKEFITAKDRHLTEQFFHLDNKCEVERLENNCLEIRSEKYYIYLIGNRGLEFELFRGSLDPIIGWQSSELGVKYPTWSVRGEGNFKGEISLITFIIVRPERKSLEELLKIKEDYL